MAAEWSFERADVGIPWFLVGANDLLGGKWKSVTKFVAVIIEAETSATRQPS